MADKDSDKTPDQSPPPPANESESQRVNRGLAEAAQAAEARQMDELPNSGDGWAGATIAGEPVGGVYIVNGVKVGPDGTPIKKG